MNRGGEHVVGAIAPYSHDRWDAPAFRLEAVATQHFDRPVADHLVGVHIARSARAGLKHVDRKLLVEFALGHFAGRGEHGIDLLGIQPHFASAGQLAEIAIGNAGCIFHQAHRMNQRPRQRTAGDRKIIDCAVEFGPRSTPWRARGHRPLNRVRFEIPA